MTKAVPDGSARKVVVIDEDDDVRRSTARILALHGYTCLEASSCAEARARLAAEPDISAALCDITIPGTKGMKPLADLAGDFPDLAVVMMSTVDDQRAAEAAFDLGVVGYVPKPFEANELLIHLACALRRCEIDAARRSRVRELESRLPITTGATVREAAGEENHGIRVLIVDDHAIFADSLVRLLESKPGLSVVGTADSVASAVAAALLFKPDVVLMDFELPDGDGVQATEQIKALMPLVHVIMLTARSDDQALVRAIAAGCSGFVSKIDSVPQLLKAIVAAHEGEPYLPPKELALLLQQLAPTMRGLGADLTRRELEVLRLMASGLINKRIARRLGLRLNTVRNHSQNILYKLRAHSRLEAIAIAVRDGIIAYPAATGDST